MVRTVMNTYQAPLPVIEVELRDGSMAQIRPVVEGDRALMEEGLAHMSLQTRLSRFGSPVDHFSKAELDYLTRIDLIEHVAWGALITGMPAASGRYIRPEAEQEAEMAVAVVDRFQRRGLGRILFEALVASARYNRIDGLYFAIQPANTVVLDMLDGVEMHLDEREGLVVGHFSVGDVSTGPNDERFVELLRWYQKRG